MGSQWLTFQKILAFKAMNGCFLLTLKVKRVLGGGEMAWQLTTLTALPEVSPALNIDFYTYSQISSEKVIWRLTTG